MITSPAPEKQLTPQELEKIDLAHDRLVVVQYEVIKATKELAALEEEIKKAQAAKDYADEQFGGAERELSDARKEKEEVIEGLKLTRAEQETLQKQISQEKETHQKLRDLLSKREEITASNEKDFSKRNLVLEKKEKEVEADKKLVEDAKSTLLDAIAKITWK